MERALLLIKTIARLFLCRLVPNQFTHKLTRARVHKRVLKKFFETLRVVNDYFIIHSIAQYIEE